MPNSLRMARRFCGPPGAASFQDYRTGSQATCRERNLSSDGLFVLQVSERTAGTNSWDLKGSESEDRGIVGTDADRRRALGSFARRPVGAGGQHAVHRAIIAWDTRTAEHQAIYAHPNANLYLANFSKDGRWALFTSEEAAAPRACGPRPFADCRMFRSRNGWTWGRRLSALVSRRRTHLFHAGTRRVRVHLHARRGSRDQAARGPGDRGAAFPRPA
jgi:hypothetical protein